MEEKIIKKEVDIFLNKRGIYYLSDKQLQL